VAKLGIADPLERGPKSPAALAETVGAHAEALGRLLRSGLAAILEIQWQGTDRGPCVGVPSSHFDLGRGALQWISDPLHARRDGFGPFRPRCS
jgi:hypothetical protein